jgi:acylphosphatase
MPDQESKVDMKKLHQKEGIETIRASIRGNVQGVGFRAAAVREAHLLGVTGWIRNNQDGSVEALMQGSQDPIDRMLSWLHIGPPGAKVRDVEHVKEQADRYFDRFEQI